mmetsp:Transcript_12554/g.12350  ORF Transcript_12554/g.12350 Transcript_12554/m.12350 type:complete len:155 (-) Transcript_12554:669-1133(-)
MLQQRFRGANNLQMTPQTNNQSIGLSGDPAYPKISPMSIPPMKQNEGLPSPFLQGEGMKGDRRMGIGMGMDQMFFMNQPQMPNWGNQQPNFDYPCGQDYQFFQSNFQDFNTKFGDAPDPFFPNNEKSENKLGLNQFILPQKALKRQNLGPTNPQ